MTTISAPRLTVAESERVLWAVALGYPGDPFGLSRPRAVRFAVAPLSATVRRDDATATLRDLPSEDAPDTLTPWLLAAERAGLPSHDAQPYREAWQWHRQHSGGAHPLAGTALQLARAERRAIAEGWWEHVALEDDHALSGELVIVLHDADGEIIGTMGGVEPTPDGITREDLRTTVAVLALAHLEHLAEQRARVLTMAASVCTAAAEELDVSEFNLPAHLALEDCAAILRRLADQRGSCAPFVAVVLVLVALGAGLLLGAAADAGAPQIPGSAAGEVAP